MAPYIISYLFYVLSILTHVLIISKKISFNLVNGGRSTSFEEQVKTSYVSIGILLLASIFIVFNQVISSFNQSLFSIIFLGILTLYWFAGFIMQLLGTWFEKRIMSIVLLLGIISHAWLFILSL